jgi:hypothetical protein
MIISTDEMTIADMLNVLSAMEDTTASMDRITNEDYDEIRVRMLDIIKIIKKYQDD